ncbi:MAG: hypothetical protein ACI4P3_04220 [Candidatus Spyradosoma sp.]
MEEVAEERTYIVEELPNKPFALELTRKVFDLKEGEIKGLASGRVEMRTRVEPAEGQFRSREWITLSELYQMSPKDVSNRLESAPFFFLANTQKDFLGLVWSPEALAEKKKLIFAKCADAYAAHDLTLPFKTSEECIYRLSLEARYSGKSPETWERVRIFGRLKVDFQAEIYLSALKKGKMKVADLEALLRQSRVVKFRRKKKTAFWFFSADVSFREGLEFNGESESVPNEATRRSTGRRLSRVEEGEMMERLRDGATQTQVAEDFGVSVQTVLNVRKRTCPEFWKFKQRRPRPVKVEFNDALAYSPE